ncbi:hypothetical protein MVLG_00427 [Microbotryum lychnidis-dioicae p1A1 Lamole]|uniref:Uncharacterized protein n=1 Tax=Microbotryum lychnidis-dioicae (strain p1A1 Lamole / MvSl-1064) TaxID=683840 RepID=U5GZ20_USTV1|nr:hypothetical protein MVLG_00427 [Microbotryum lychnidis-dioicae p1A1 Lamole]|eukprot:KDE09529.1 hypothetical protein MVLG_00427 [Microbotryum lychnidis-dioicae p1A1 Lamole]
MEIQRKPRRLGLVLEHISTQVSLQRGLVEETMSFRVSIVADQDQRNAFGIMFVTSSVLERLKDVAAFVEDCKLTEHNYIDWDLNISLTVAREFSFAQVRTDFTSNSEGHGEVPPSGAPRAVREIRTVALG